MAMTSRIKELEAQCWKDTSPDWAENYRFEFDIEKFAELIIKECCVEINLDTRPSNDYASGEWHAGHDQGMRQAIQSIKNRFSNGTV